MTFLLGTVLIGGLISVLEPEQLGRFRGLLPANLRFLTDKTTARLVGVVFLSGVAVYVIGSIFKFRPLIIRGFQLEYPKPDIAARQLLAAPLKSSGRWNHLFRFAGGRQSRLFHRARSIHRLVWRRALRPARQAAWVSLTGLFITAMPEMRNTEVLAALLVFRLAYLLIPLFC